MDYFFVIIGLILILLVVVVAMGTALLFRLRTIEDCTENFQCGLTKDQMAQAHSLAVQVKAARDTLTMIHDLSNPALNYSSDKVLPDIFDLSVKALMVLQKTKL